MPAHQCERRARDLAEFYAMKEALRKPLPKSHQDDANGTDPPRHLPLRPDAPRWMFDAWPSKLAFQKPSACDQGAIQAEGTS